MKLVSKRLLVSVTASMGLGALAIVPVVNSENGYVAGFVFLPIFFLIGIVAFVLFVAGLVTITKKPGPFLLLSALLLPMGFFGAAIVAKHLELGAYREDPMIPFPPPIANKVLFKKEATHEDIEKFWTHIIGYPTGETSHWSRPGVAGAARTPAENGHEVVTFSFRPGATEEQIADIRERINSYPPVYQYLENVDTSPQTEQAKPMNGNSAVPVKKATTLRYEQ